MRIVPHLCESVNIGIYKDCLIFLPQVSYFYSIPRTVCETQIHCFDLLRNADKMYVSGRFFSTECSKAEAYCPVFIIGK
jgi:hypothetical protein